MQESLAVMQTALKILTAITEKRSPDPADVVALHRYVGAQPVGIDLDEFACTVIQEAMKRRAEVRAAGRNSN